LKEGWSYAERVGRPERGEPDAHLRSQLAYFRASEWAGITALRSQQTLVAIENTRASIGWPRPNTVWRCTRTVCVAILRTAFATAPEPATLALFDQLRLAPGNG
jgi:hypothetical protein